MSECLWCGGVIEDDRPVAFSFGGVALNMPPNRCEVCDQHLTFRRKVREMDDDPQDIPF